jgi:hypothetical protein
MLGPARAQTGTEAGWLDCMDVWEDEAICGPRPLPPPPPPPPEEEPLPPPPPPPPPPEEEPLPPPPPPPPPTSDACAKGNQHGFGLSHSRGNANGHCDSGDRHAKKHKHARRQDHRAKAKALLSQLARWCKALAHNGRHS